MLLIGTLRKYFFSRINLYSKQFFLPCITKSVQLLDLCFPGSYKKQVDSYYTGTANEDTLELQWC